MWEPLPKVLEMFLEISVAASLQNKLDQTFIEPKRASTEYADDDTSAKFGQSSLWGQQANDGPSDLVAMIIFTCQQKCLPWTYLTELRRA